MYVLADIRTSTCTNLEVKVQVCSYYIVSNSQKQLADSLSAVKSMEKSLRARPGDAPVSEDDKDREIQILTFEIHRCLKLYALHL